MNITISIIQLNLGHLQASAVLLLGERFYNGGSQNMETTVNGSLGTTGIMLQT